MNATNGAMPVLVTGATGNQGGAVVKALLKRGVAVRALVRDTAKAASLAAAGVELALGSLDDKASLLAACGGAKAVFSMQAVPVADPDSERRQARNLVEAARLAGVPHMIHSSVSGTGSYLGVFGTDSQHWPAWYWDSKCRAEAYVRLGGFPFYTILRPALINHNFTMPTASYMFPDLVNDELLTALEPQATYSLVATDDVGEAAAAAVLDPEKFDRAEIELAGDVLTMDEIAQALSDATGRTIVARSMAKAELVARGQWEGVVDSQAWNNRFGYPARPEHARAYGLELMTFRRWAELHADKIARR